jgi:uncharacterized membrane protein YjgN (DUF898 family)
MKLEHGDVLLLGDKKFICHFTDAESLPSFQMGSKTSSSNTATASREHSATDSAKLKLLYGQNINAPAKNYKFSFNASSAELIMLMIKNVIFTLLTLGLYIPYARTNVRKFIWKSTSLNSSAFLFKGDPSSLRNSYLKLLVMLVAFRFVDNFIISSFIRGNPTLVIIHYLINAAAIFVFYIWARYGAYCYLVNHTSYRSLNFIVKKGGASAHLNSSITGSIFTIFTLGIYYPFMTCGLEKIRWNKTQYGNLAFKYAPNEKEFAFQWFKGIFISIISLGIYYPWHVVGIHKYRLSHLKLGQAQFQSSANGGEYLMVCLKSILLLVFTLGLGAPVVMNLNLAYFFKNASLKGNINFDDIIAEAKSNKSGSFSEAAADVLDIDSDIGL